MRAFAYRFVVEKARYRELMACQMASRVACCDMREMARRRDEGGGSGQGKAKAVCTEGGKPLLIPIAPALASRPWQALQQFPIASRNRPPSLLARRRTSGATRSALYSLVQNFSRYRSALTSSLSYALAWPQGCRRERLLFSGPGNIEIYRWSGGRDRRSLVR